VDAVPEMHGFRVRGDVLKAAGVLFARGAHVGEAESVEDVRVGPNIGVEGDLLRRNGELSAIGQIKAIRERYAARGCNFAVECYCSGV